MKKLTKKVENFLKKNKINSKITKIDDGLFETRIPVKGSLEGLSVIIEQNSYIKIEPKEEYHIVINAWVYGKKDAQLQKDLTKKLLKIFPKALVIESDSGFDYNPNSIQAGTQPYDGQSTCISELWGIFDVE